MSQSAQSAELDSNYNAALRKVAWRLIPFLGFLYVLNLLDRSNVGFARKAIQHDLELSPEAFDLGYGIFYLGYLAFEVPANLLLRRVGARRWIARIMISWGLVSCATLAVTGPASFYAVRILLGVAEAGFFPGIIFYLTFWFTARERARVTALFMTANAVTGIVGNPLSGAIMQFIGNAGGLRDWQWLFLLEGIPSVIIGFIVLFYLPDGPSHAHWLTVDERNWLTDRVRQEDQIRQQRHGSDFLRALVDRRVWLLTALYATVAVGANAAAAHFPSEISRHFTTDNKFALGLLTALPHVCAMVGMTLWAAHSDRAGERRWHVAAAAIFAAAGWALSAMTDSPLIFLCGLCLAQTGMMAMLPTFWTLPTSFLSGAAAAGGIALINSVANLGGLLGPSILGQFGLPAVAAILCVGGVLAICVRHDTPADYQ
jgi:ACS family tartrate transporter-like MFS transporter